MRRDFLHISDNCGTDSFGFNVLPPEADNGLVASDIINLNGLIPNPDWDAVVNILARRERLVLRTAGLVNQTRLSTL